VPECLRPGTEGGRWRTDQPVLVHIQLEREMVQLGNVIAGVSTEK